MDRPHPPGTYPVVVLGSGPGGLQVSYELTRLGVDHAVLSRDSGPAGMFRSLPVFQRLITWSKPFAPVERSTRAYERFDRNSLLANEPHLRALVPQGMDGSSYFPSRPEMERGLVEFAERAGLRVRYGCTWEATRQDDRGRFVVVTSDGEYRCRVLVVAVGMTQPWKPDTPGIEHVPHYVETGQPRRYADRRIFVIGKRNSAFEVADGLLPWARQLILASPRPVRLSVLEHTTAGARARYLQPYEDYVLAGGNLVVDAGSSASNATATAGGCSRLSPPCRGGWCSRSTTSSAPPGSRHHWGTCLSSECRPSTGRGGCRLRRPSGRAPPCPASTSRAPSRRARSG